MAKKWVKYLSTEDSPFDVLEKLGPRNVVYEPLTKEETGVIEAMLVVCADCPAWDECHAGEATQQEVVIGYKPDPSILSDCVFEVFGTYEEPYI